MPRRKVTAGQYIERNALLVPLILGDMVEHLGQASQAWSNAVWHARNGDLDRALKDVVEVGVAVDVPLQVGRSELRAITERAGRLLDDELPDDEDTA
jgi:hypothetical protein